MTLPTYPETMPWTTAQRAYRRRLALWRFIRRGLAVTGVAVVLGAAPWAGLMLF